MAKRVNISTARKELPSLFDRVTSREGEKVVIRRRDGSREAVLVSRDYLERLEQASPRAPGKPFCLIGSGKLLVPAGEIVDVVRLQEKTEQDKRESELAPARKRSS